MSKHFQQAGDFLRETVKESARQTLREHRDDGYVRGFSSAAGITLRQLHEKLDAYREQMKSRGLSKSEQTLYVQLDELKSEIETEYDRYWRGSGDDWRPPKPIVKGTKRSEDPRSED